MKMARLACKYWMLRSNIHLKHKVYNNDNLIIIIIIIIKIIIIIINTNINIVINITMIIIYTHNNFILDYSATGVSTYRGIQLPTYQFTYSCT